MKDLKLKIPFLRRQQNVPKDYQKLWTNLLSDIARHNMASISLAPRIDRENPDSNFDLVVTLIYLGIEAEHNEEDQFFLETFRKAKMNIEDPFHWWELLHNLIMIHTDRKVGASKLWTEAKIKKLEKDCVTVGRRDPATDNITKICGRLTDDLHYRQTPQNLQTLITRLKLTDRIKKKIARFLAK